MNILVNNTAAKSRGAMVVLTAFYNKAIDMCDHTWFFLVSVPDLSSNSNINIICVPWVKNSWFHRLFFDLFYIHKFLKKYTIKHIYSLQNIIFPFTKIPQTVYIHQVIPFTKIPLKYMSINVFIYKYFIGTLIKMSIKRAESVLVQSQWLKNLLEKKYRATNIKIDNSWMLNILPIESNNMAVIPNSVKLFIYPSSPVKYKNHIVLLRAVKNVVKKTSKKLLLLITIHETDNPYVYKLKRYIDKNNLPICLIGNLKHDHVLRLLKYSTLIFPSIIESFGLPLYEAMALKSEIIATSLNFSQEALQYYDRKIIFKPFDYQELADILLKVL